jgi:hypothetical protein
MFFVVYKYSKATICILKCVIKKSIKSYNTKIAKECQITVP